ncbi:MAG: cytidine deaminase, partial [Bacteroidota bacterium]
SGLCAERVALFYASAQHPHQKIKCILVVAESENGDLNCRVSPCGACRQSISEYEQKQGSGIEIIFMHDAEAFLSCQSIKDLLPLGFDSDSLKA